MDYIAWVRIFRKGIQRHISSLENNITGTILIHANHDLLRELSMHSVGQRLSLLKTIYTLKNAQNIPLEQGDYIPECIPSNKLSRTPTLKYAHLTKEDGTKKLIREASQRGWAAN
jgi:hypothetical protein